MKVLVFRHVPFEGLGRIAESLDRAGIAYEHADLYRPGADSPDPAAYDGLIFMGGPMSANDSLPFLDRERALIAEAADRGQPMLGICLGSQLIARVLGAAVRRNPVKEIGWYDLRFTPAGSADSLFAGLAGPETVFHWHGETWDLPAGAELLASSQVCENQAFRVGQRIYGLQFHLEITPDMVRDWQQREENCGDVRTLTVPLDPFCNSQRVQELSDLVFGRWCRLL